MERAADAEELKEAEGIEGIDGGAGGPGEGDFDGSGDRWGMMSLDAMRGGALCFVTGTQGFCAAGEAVNGIVRRARAGA